MLAVDIFRSKILFFLTPLPTWSTPWHLQEDRETSGRSSVSVPATSVPDLQYFHARSLRQGHDVAAANRQRAPRAGLCAGPLAAKLAAKPEAASTAR